MFSLFISVIAIIIIVYWEKIVSFVKEKAKPEPEHEPELIEEKVSFPSNYLAESIMIVDYIHYDSDGCNMGHRDYHNKGAYTYRPASKTIIFSDGGRIHICCGSNYWNIWMSCKKYCICSRVKKMDENGFVVDCYYLPAPPSVLSFDEKAKEVTY